MKLKLIYTLSILSFFLLSSSAFAVSGKPLSDEWIKGRVQGALDYNSYFDSTDIDINVKEGKVTLSGKVPSEVERDFAVSIAHRIEGVSGVVNELKIDESLVPRNRTPEVQAVYDLTTTAAVKGRLSANREISGVKIEVDTLEGVVTLSGAVPTNDNKDLAEQIALNTRGVIDVKNNLKISDPKSLADKIENKATDISRNVSDTWISTKVRTSLAFSSNIPGSDVDVTTNNGKVTLSGSARSAQQKQEIQNTVENVYGVKEVINQLGIRKQS